MSAARLARLGSILHWLGGGLLIAGFASPWIYGPLGKSRDFGWQPVWGLLLNFIPANLFIVFCIVSCFSYLELSYRWGVPVLSGVLKWVGAFFGLLALPFTWFIFDQTQRSPASVQPEGTLGWGVWLAMLGLVSQVIALRIAIYQLKNSSDVHQPKPET